ncbi:glycerol-3-phosphate dehydrogenase/oxidase [Halodesulfovibrio sp.]|jgi:glycerol-3-phosphate dehydrogenase|uniref:glycerol-3-phosphate dehydrogenase/oxidase n=1 Tax=Halodesulfovibrio sp. TaxID=1912772 RepID=UPI0025FC9F98|nr:glycerol-3-phosphate dehydrogenase/oxidase [Halodesulfovibrio sp.]MCT4536047.1 glycerol-3-phosphate dehydrogenase/oxidase [Halodesulfovibrio sp.]
MSVQRSESIERIESQDVWDVLIIGGGATGLGSGVDAASRGYSTVLLESADFGQATSSRSTKLAHGGVRYLEQMNFSLVYDALHERGRMRRNAPHLVDDQSFIVPTYSWWETLYYGAGLVVYDLLSGPFSFGFSYPMIRNRVFNHVPGLNPAKVKAGVRYHDGQFDDSRYVMALALTMNDLGGCPVNHMQVVSLIKEEETVRGVVAVDLLTGKEHKIYARSVVNATGVFTDDIRQMDDPSVMPILQPSQGIHLMLDREFCPGEAGILIPKTDDGRVVFVLPWHDKLIIGTTDTEVDAPEMEPRATDAEVDFLLEHVGRFLARKPQRKDVRSVFNGIRPLIKAEGSGATSTLSRDHYLTVSPSGLVTIAGGKWTTYRKMAEDVVNTCAKTAGLPEADCRTSNLPLHGWTRDFSKSDPLRVYGSDAENLYDLLDEDDCLAELVHSRLPYRKVEVVWAVRSEMAHTLYGVLALRTRALLLDAEATIEAAPEVARLMAVELGLSGDDADAWIDAQLAEFREVAALYVAGNCCEL